ncbi:MAG: alanine--tRNA ligase [Armatimonadetes bacterium]|nr:alanine--tRNA ligase [Armatimonadota bacterium]
MHTTNQLRRMYLDFFVSKGHKILSSASLVPDDPTLLLTGAGMNPFKAYFIGAEAPPSRRVTTCQKCLRTVDFENVGRTPRHHTFFEMMGNFSFADYFKKESIEWAWEFCLQWLKLPEDKLWVSVYLDDDEAEGHWLNVGVPKERILRLGEDDNFWPASAPSKGPNGPCGPCSEIFLDRGPAYGSDAPGANPATDSNRFLEFWNLVFQVYDRKDGGVLAPLPQRNIDTGLGLDRMASIIQNVPSNFDTDLFAPIMVGIDHIVRESGNPEGVGQDLLTSARRVIADHIRAVVFLIADGVFPSNEGRGYVLRRILRRAARFGYRLGVREPFLYSLVPTVIQVMEEPYPELVPDRERIQTMSRLEEDRFQEALAQGMNLLEERLADTSDRIVSGADAFRLYDTFGFPLDLTQEVAEERGFTVDEKGFREAMEAQRARGRAHQSDDIFGGLAANVYTELASRFGETAFLGYETEEAESKVLALVREGRAVEKLDAGEKGEVLLGATPFYAESGGQVGDTGMMRGEDFRAAIEDTQKKQGLIYHQVSVEEGALRKGTPVQAVVASGRRQALRRAHTSTHLLHWALRQVLGTHVAQAGSLVEPDRLRFDFSHYAAMSDEEVGRVEVLINGRILQDHPVEVNYKGLEEARAGGAMALFGEKYGEVVRVVSMDDFSRELCGGTHLERSAQAGLCKIVSEGSVGAGIRRIEALTGMAAYRYVRHQEEILARVADILKTGPADAAESARAAVSALRNAEKRIESLQAENARLQADTVAEKAVQFGDVRLVTHRVEGEGDELIKSLADGLAERLGSGVVVLGGATGGRVVFIAKVTPDLVKRGFHAGNLLREVAKVAGGGGGGRPDFAQAGGKDPARLPDALAKASELIEAQARK